MISAHTVIYKLIRNIIISIHSLITSKCPLQLKVIVFHICEIIPLIRKRNVFILIILIILTSAFQR